MSLSKLFTPIAILTLLASTTTAAAAHPRCPLSITYTTPPNCPAIACISPTCTKTTTTIIPSSYCGTKTRTACIRSCPTCSTETVTVDQNAGTLHQPTLDLSNTDTVILPTAEPPIILPTDAPTPTEGPSNLPSICPPFTVTSTAPNPACTFDTSECVRPLCLWETTVTVPACGQVVTETVSERCATACPGGCATFTYTSTAGAF